MFCPHRSACKKASQSLSPAGGKGILIIFCRGAPQGGLSCPFGAIHLLYLTENTYQAASLAPQRCAERNRRRRLLARSCAICTPKAYKSCARQTAILLSKRAKPFLTVSNRCGCSVHTGFWNINLPQSGPRGSECPGDGRRVCRWRSEEPDAPAFRPPASAQTGQ